MITGTYKIPSKEEYRMLRSEVIARIGTMNTQSSNAINITVAIWAAGFAILGFRSSSSLSKLVDLNYLYLGQIASFLFSIVILYPLSLKSGENLRQLASIGAYIRIFYEYIPCIRHMDTEIYLWETFDKQVNEMAMPQDTSLGIEYFLNIIKSLFPWHDVDYAFEKPKLDGKTRYPQNMYNMEYFILGVMSFIFFSITSVDYMFYLIKNTNDLNTRVVLFIFILLILFCIYFLRRISISSSGKNNFAKYLKDDLWNYLLIAVNKNIITMDEMQNAWKEFIGSTE